VDGNEVRRSTEYVVRYPTHPPRKASALYRKTRKDLCARLGCFICGAMEGLEAHHFFVAWAALEAVDWQRFGEAAQNLYNPQTGIHLGTSFDWSKVAARPVSFVDSPANMVVLCEEHHRSEQRGVHQVPFPDWILQRFSRSDFKFLWIQ
jgi:hypothetical protein